ncbi:hypothetical protein BIV25_08280 [Streptomyces sp. MUSC 14]|nr:hypothetical protein BIV25_08280 [Streptomyces sp. MUSC 14]
MTRPDTVVLGLGLATPVPAGGVDAMHGADVDGGRLAGFLIDAGPGLATDSVVVNSNDVIIDHTWLWRADHGLTVDGGDVLATGLVVEHFNKHDVYWSGERGRTIFFQNEQAYDAPNAAAVTRHEAWAATAPARPVPRSSGPTASRPRHQTARPARDLARRQRPVRPRRRRCPSPDLYSMIARPPNGVPGEADGAACGCDGRRPFVNQ